MLVIDLTVSIPGHVLVVLIDGFRPASDRGTSVPYPTNASVAIDRE